MVQRLINSVLLCLLFLMCGGGNAARDFNAKYTEDLKGTEMKDLEDKYKIWYFHKSNTNDLKDGEIRDLEDKYKLWYFHKSATSNLNDAEIKDLEDKYKRWYFHKSDTNDLKDGEMQDLEDKYKLWYFHKGATNDLKDFEMKSLEDKYKLWYFHKGNIDNLKDGEMQDLEDKYKLWYFHKSATNDPRDVKMKNLKDKYKLWYFHKSNTNNLKDAEMKDLKDKYKLWYFHKSATNDLKEVKIKDLEDKYKLWYFHKNTENKDNVKHHGHNHDESAKVGLFTLDQLHGLSVGEKLPIFFPIKDHSLYPPSLPKEVADSIPFSSSQVSNILRFFSVSPESPKGKAVQDTLKKCELEAAEGETKVCATSIESLHGFLSNAFGPEVDIKFLSTSHPTLTTPILQNYTVLETPREIESPKKVACHPMPYLYAVYFCHFDATESKAFKLQLVGDITGDKVDALVLCHMDTSGWSSDHAAFRMLGIKHGDAACHVFSEGNVVWVNQPSAITVQAA